MQDINRQIYSPEDEIDLLEYWRIIWKRKKLISIIIIVMVFLTVAGSLFMTDIYQAKAVITPVSSSSASSSSLSSLASQFGGIASLAGVSLPGSSSSSEIVNYLNSKALREKVIIKYNLLPVLFPDKWDSEKKAWKEPGVLGRIVLSVKVLVKSIIPKKTEESEGGLEEDAVTVWDGLRYLEEEVLVIASDTENNSISISVNLDSPQNAARIVNYFLTTLTDHMSGESKRVAEANRKHLEEQLARASDPIIRQKIYTLLSQQVETALMSEVKENFAFKVIDPPKVPDENIKPKRAVIVVLSFMVAIFIGVFVAFVMDYIEKTRMQNNK